MTVCRPLIGWTEDCSNLCIAYTVFTFPCYYICQGLGKKLMIETVT